MSFLLALLLSHMTLVWFLLSAVLLQQLFSPQVLETELGSTCDPTLDLTIIFLYFLSKKSVAISIK